MKKYCKDCKFKLWYTLSYCEPWVAFGVRGPDYHSPRHLIRKKKIGSFEREVQNRNNDCRCYKKKWWKFWI